MDWSYIAGFIDGEGSLILYRYKEKREPFREYLQTRLDMVQSTRPVLEEIRLFLVAKGCLSVSLFAQPNAGFKSTGILYRLSMASKHDLELVLLNVLPYLVVKKQKAVELLEVLRTRRGRVGANRKRNDVRMVNRTI